MGQPVPCPDCNGHPEDTDDGDYCQECGGDGYVEVGSDNWDDQSQTNVCPELFYQNSSYICSSQGNFFAQISPDSIYINN